MLELAEVSWKNFLSYGDYLTTIPIDKLGQCLITGLVLDEDEKTAYDSAPVGRPRKSNGAGKSCIPSVIEWVLFGYTMHSATPAGDGVINWFTGQNCWAQIVFKNGDSITRTRNYNGCNELIFIKDGDENRSNADTLSTAKHQQQQLNKAFNLDLEIFRGATFFNQYGRPWMEMADQARKKALERLLHVDRFTYYANAAKGKCDKLDTMVAKWQHQKETLEAEISRLDGDIGRFAAANASFTERQQARHQELLNAADREIQTRDTLDLPDLAKLKARWEVIAQVQQKIQDQQQQAERLRQQANQLDNTISKHASQVTALRGRIKLWQDKNGEICTTCEQAIPADHVASRIEPLITQQQTAQEQLQTLTAQQQTLREQYQSAVDIINQTKAAVVAKQPKLTLRDAQAIHTQWQRHAQEADRLQRQAAAILTEANPHNDSITTARQRIADCQEKITELVADIDRHTFLNRHYNYIHKAYNDRNKIKSFIFKEHVPFLNSRLHHYLDAFGLDVQIELTDALAVVSNQWEYKYQSGGERKRTDVAFMLATFDFHERLYGRQCNVLVLDEVDGRLDDDGLDSLINIIKNDFGTRAETVLIISHKNLMQDTFPRQVSVVREQRFSRIDSIL